MSVTCITNNYGTKHWCRNRKLHRDGDLPALEYANGDKEWYQNGNLHRDGDLPAVENASCSKEWYQNGKCHRDSDQPAVEYEDGSKEWYQNGEHHRDGDQPAIEYASGRKSWYKYDKKYTHKQIVNYYSQLTYFGKYCLRKIKMNRLKHKRWIHGELLCRPPKANYAGGADYHKMVDYFSKLY